MRRFPHLRILILALALLLCVPLHFSCTSKDNELNSDSSEPTVSSTEPIQPLPTQPNSSDISEKPRWDKDGELKILCIGNSFSIDSMQYLYGILEDMGIEKIKLGNLYVSGCSLQTHLTNAQTNNAGYTYYINTSGSRSDSEGYRMADVIRSDIWDFICFQQASHESGDAPTYKYLSDLIDYVEKISPTSRFVWNMTWAYQQDSTHSFFPKYDSNQITMYNAIVSATESKVLAEKRIELVIPAGTAIQNARASWLGDTLTRDGYHLSDPLGRYIVALTFAEALTGTSVENVKYCPAGVSERQSILAKECAMLALKTPFAQSKPQTPAPEEISLDNYSLLALDFQRGFWNSVGAAGTEFDRVQGSELANKFYSTQVFTKEELPVGSVIVLADGWQYRPEGWINSSVISSSLRPSVTSSKVIVIDDVWWGDFSERAFNVCKKPQVSLMDLEENDMREVFQIYVPR